MNWPISQYPSTFNITISIQGIIRTSDCCTHVVKAWLDSITEVYTYSGILPTEYEGGGSIIMC